MKIQFLKDTSKAIIDTSIDDTLLVYKEGYKIPNLKNIEYMEFNKFKTVYSELHFNRLIIVGLNKIIIPANRCEMVNDFIQTMTRNIPKISIDSSPFIGEPWRLWYHYDVTGCEKFNVPHGYAIETEWKKWFYRDTNLCRLSADNIKMFISNTYSDLDKLTTTFDFFDVDSKYINRYNATKLDVINTTPSPKSIINNLLKRCNKFFKVDIGVNSYKENKKFLVPNLGIYRFIVEENKRRMDIYNAIISSGKREL